MPRGYPNDPNRTWSRQPKKKGTKKVVARKAAPMKRKPEQKASIAKRSVRRNTMVAVSKVNMEAAILSTLQSVCQQLLRLEGAIYARPYISQPILQNAGALGDTMARYNREKELAEKMQAINNGNHLTEQGCCGGKAMPGLAQEGVNLAQQCPTESTSRKRRTSNPNIKAVPEKAPVEEKGLDELTDEDMMV